MVVKDLIPALSKHPNYKVQFVVNIGPDEIEKEVRMRFQGYQFTIDHDRMAVLIGAFEVEE